MASADAKCVMLVKSILAARDILLEELQRLSKAIDLPLDLTDFISEMDDIKFPDYALQGNVSPPDGKVSGQGKQQNGFEVLTCFMQHRIFVIICNFYAELLLMNVSSFFQQKAKSTLRLQSNESLLSLPRNVVLNSLHVLGDQVSYLWNTFLQFHRFCLVPLLGYFLDIR